MNPTMSSDLYQSETMPLQGPHGPPGYPGQPTAPAVVQYTSVSVGVEPPQDHVLWSLCCFFYGNPLCLGLVALIYSIKSRDRKVVGDLEGARHYGSTARSLNIAATIIISIVISLFIIIPIVLVSQMTTTHYNRYYPPRY